MKRGAGQAEGGHKKVKPSFVLEEISHIRSTGASGGQIQSSEPQETIPSSGPGRPNWKERQLLKQKQKHSQEIKDEEHCTKAFEEWQSLVWPQQIQFIKNPIFLQ